QYEDIEEWRDWLKQAPSLKTAAFRVARRSGHQGRLEPTSIREYDQLARGAGVLTPLGGLTQRDVFSRLSSALRFACVDRHWIEHNPCDSVSRPRPQRSKRKQAPRKDTIMRLIEQVFNERWGAAVIIAVTAGLRKGEVLALRWEDIDWRSHI